jgi:hypothetical protein
MRKPGKRNLWLAILVAAIGTAALTGCRENEQDRIIRFEQGVYKGNPDTQLDAEQVGELRSRAERQQY